MSLIPDNLQVPPGMNPRQFLISLPAMNTDQIPKGADTTMTTDGPDQVWFLVVAIICIAVPGLFLILRVYTRMAIMQCLEPADCKYDRIVLVLALTFDRFLTLSFRMAY
jgi:hypothetical protein